MPLAFSKKPAGLGAIWEATIFLSHPLLAKLSVLLDSFFKIIQPTKRKIMEEYDKDKFLVIGGDDDGLFSENPPVWRGVVLFLGVVLLGVMLTVVIIYCSWVNEISKKNKRRGTRPIQRQSEHEPQHCRSQPRKLIICDSRHSLPHRHS